MVFVVIVVERFVSEIVDKAVIGLFGSRERLLIGVVCCKVVRVVTFLENGVTDMWVRDGVMVNEADRERLHSFAIF